ncbi:RNA helicase [Ranunculus cassubicifolius]
MMTSKEGSTFEDARDWLCLSLPGNEVPLKFSSGTSLNDEGSISIISTAQEDWAPLSDPSAEDEKNMLEVPFQIKERVNDDTMEMRQPSETDWIKQYVEQQEEVKDIPSLPKCETKGKNQEKRGLGELDLNKIIFEEGELHSDPEKRGLGELDLNKIIFEEGELHSDPEKRGLGELDLNKIIFEEGALHSDPEMQRFIISMLKILFPKFF